MQYQRPMKPALLRRQLLPVLRIDLQDHVAASNISRVTASRVWPDLDGVRVAETRLAQVEPQTSKPLRLGIVRAGRVTVRLQATQR